MKKFSNTHLLKKLILVGLLGLSIVLIYGESVSAQGIAGKDKREENHAPIINNLRYDSGMLYLDARGSYIELQNAKLIVDSTESFPLNLDESGVFFRVGKDRTSSPSGVKIAEAIPHGKEVMIIVENPNGIKSAPVKFSR